MKGSEEQKWMGKSYRDLLVWKKAKQFAVCVYRHTEQFPRSEIYGLTSQLRRAAVSVPSNVAEGQGRVTPGEFKQFLGTARGSLCELQTQLEIAYDLGYLSLDHHGALQKQANEVRYLLNRLIKSIQQNDIERQNVDARGFGTSETSPRPKPAGHAESLLNGTKKMGSPGVETSETSPTSETS
jgi:four helix bundle protein